MTFNSLQYFAFLALVLLLYYRLRMNGQNRLIVVAGSVFYGAFDWRFLGLLYISTITDYIVGRALGNAQSDRARKALVGVSLVVQLGILAFFKYADFFADSAQRFMALFGLEADPFTLNVLLPVGISFYTFQTLAYIFAVYRRQLEPERNLVTFAAFVAWFPQMVAGPIERAPSLLSQIRRRRDWPGAARAESAVLVILRGLVKKVVIADSIAPYVTEVYTSPGSFRWSALVLATVGFALQVYGDFSGYSDIARGSSRLLGVELRRNFEQPFLSRDIRELWQRWHTSLGGWFVEHVAQPLGGSRRGPRRAALNVLLVFTLIGLWHGAAWTFVAWGFFNGLLVTLWRRRPVPPGRHPMLVRWREAPAIAFTFGLFCLGVVLFRAETFADAGRVLRGVLTLQDGTEPASSGWIIPLMLVAVIALDLSERHHRIRAIESLRVRMNLGGVPTPAEAAAESYLDGSSAVRAGVLVGVMVGALVLFSGAPPTPFIYFQF